MSPLIKGRGGWFLTVLLLVMLMVPTSAASARPSAPPMEHLSGDVLEPGDTGAAVVRLQRRLAELRYWLGTVDGTYGELTEQAVLAFQKVNGLRRDGITGPETRAALEHPVRPLARSRGPLSLEAVQDAQVLLLSRFGHVRRIFNAATGTASTPTPNGRYRIYREIHGWHRSPLGLMYNPKYFVAGYAIHGALEIPAWPASHGCVRVSVAAADFLWRRIPIGTPVSVNAAMRSAAPLAAQAGVQTRIAFSRSAGATDAARHYEIFTMAADGSDVVRLTRNDAEDSFPSFSPDGRRIAFASNRDGIPHIYVMNIDGTRTRRLTGAGNGDSLPEWSPDGRWIVFTRNFVLEQQSDLFKVASDGGRAIRLTATPAIEFAPEWSPDGRLIAYTRVDQRLMRFGIAAGRPDGSGRRWIVVNPRSDAGYGDAYPTWSPSGARLAFTRETADRTMDIFSVRRDGSGVRRLTDRRLDAQNPTWSSDGRIAVMLGNDIAVMQRDGSRIRLITSAEREASSPRPFTWPDWGPAAP
jgi:peptidoglycan hydrolase-like protein with peptidoglycan-binding domain